jgi:hypothetical protein
MGGDVAGCSDNGVIGSGKGVELAFITAWNKFDWN